ncbi:MAG TPA: YebC/PmpR family DNA-binding transcriptional regulator [Acholeplasmataceae bacterium]|mgnify:CR=1 FL=1|nr:YebC/PmpR family DNA-binding transcriptional regulator [Acholeplasmataceae bacterium]
MGRAYQVRAASMAKTAAQKSKLYAQYGVAIYKAAKSGIPDPDSNLNLKKEIERARKANVPSSVIQRAIEKAKGGLSGTFQEVRYEGFGPNNSMIIVDCVTDNPNRTYTAIRTAFTRTGCKLGVNGSVTHMFDYVSIFSFEGLSADEALEILLAADCEITDIDSDEGLTSVIAPASEYQKIKDALLEAKPDLEFVEDEVTFNPQMYVTLEADEDINHFRKLLAFLRELDDVQQIYHNVEGIEEEEE